MKKIWVRVVLLALLLMGTAQAEVAVPPLTHRVTDLTATLDAQQAQTLESQLAAFEKNKGTQLAVLIVPTTQPESIEQYGIRVVEAWKLGRKGVDDGALLLVAKDDHALRIEVGYGLEGVLNDATAHRIVDEVIAPRFKRGDFYGGIASGLSTVMQVVNGESLPPPKRAAASGSYNNIEGLLFVAFGAVVMVGGMLRALLGRFPAALLMGGGLGVLAWLTVAPLLVALLVGVMAFVFVLLGGSAGRGFTGYGGGGFGGGYGGGGFGGGGGFSGGGGGFGGGGASGRW
ncbi:MAG: YgcG family protein [Nitrosomonadales bacterium]|nr:YgcG family protein [Nitrosomonadales bacterium]